MTSALRKQIFRSRQAQSGNKRIELTLTPEEQKLLGPRPAQALKAMLSYRINCPANAIWPTAVAPLDDVAMAKYERGETVGIFGIAQLEK